MRFLEKLFGKKTPPPPRLEVEAAEPASDWPNQSSWGAMRAGQSIQTADGPRALSVISCGELMINSGKLIACDPFAGLSKEGMPYFSVPKGKHPVHVTLADVSKNQDASHIREAYASIIFTNQVEAYRKALSPIVNGNQLPETTGDEFHGFFVDAGTACFVDASYIANLMPPQETWLEGLFDNERPDCWFKRMDDPAHIREGIANITLPLAQNGENLILFHSGWGDGSYPVIGSFDDKNQLIAVHVDLLVVQ